MNMGSHLDHETTKQQLRSLNDYVTFYVDRQQCLKFIQSITEEKIFLIISGAESLQVIPLVHDYSQIDSIYIFCMKIDRYKHLVDLYSKVIGIYNEIDELCCSLRKEMELFDRQLETFSIFDQHQNSTKDLSHQSAEFLWLQLFHHLIVRLPLNQQAKKEMIDVCRRYYRGNEKEQRLIGDFEQNYQSHNAIWWYSRESFVYKIVNKALRTENLDHLQTFRFFIGDLSRQIAEHKTDLWLSKETDLIVYRGTRLDPDELARLHKNLGHVISTNGYFSTSRSKSVALNFATESTRRLNAVGILFEINCCISQIGNSVTFADIRPLSEIEEEHEILFDLNASFRLESIEKEAEIHKIKMTLTNEGDKIKKQYIEAIQKESEDMSVTIIFGKLLCDLGKYESSLKFFEELLQEPSSEEDVAWITFHIGRALDYLDKKNEARYYYDRAYEYMMAAEPPRVKDSARVLNNIGGLLRGQKRYDEALNYLDQALRIREEYFPADHGSIATTLNNIANIMFRQNDMEGALKTHQRVLAMNKQFYNENHPNIAHSLSNIASILQSQGNFNQALSYTQDAFAMSQKCYPSAHQDIASYLCQLGEIHAQQGEYHEALKYYDQVVEMNRRLYPHGHQRSAKVFVKCGDLLYEQKMYREAIQYYEKALNFYKESGAPDDIDLIKIVEKVELCRNHQTSSTQ